MTKTVKSYTDSFIEILTLYVVLMFGVSIGFSFIEDKSLFDSIWWACATAMTVGYGDIFPATVAGKVLAMVWMHIVPLIVVPLIITRLMTHIVEDKNQFSDSEQEEIKNLLKYIKAQIEQKNPDSGTTTKK